MIKDVLKRLFQKCTAYVLLTTGAVVVARITTSIMICRPQNNEHEKYLSVLSNSRSTPVIDELKRLLAIYINVPRQPFENRTEIIKNIRNNRVIFP